MQTLRLKIIQEIVETEKNYVQYLQVLIDIFEKPLTIRSQCSSSPITLDQVREIFSAIIEIHNFHVLLLQRLDERYKNWSQTEKIADIFIDIIHFLKMYTQYVNNYNLALNTLATCMKNPVFVMFIKKCESHPQCSGKDFNSLLITPIQRIPRYSLLLEELRKNTWKEHPDFENIQIAARRMRETAEIINERKREYEAMSKIMAIQDIVAGNFEPFCKPHRRFIRESKDGELSIVVDQRAKVRQFFLFNDILVLAGKNDAVFSNGKRYKFEREIALNRCVLRMNIPLKGEDKNDKSELQFQIVVVNYVGTHIQSQESITVTCPTLQIKNAWIEDLKKSIILLKEKRHSYDRVLFAKETLTDKEEKSGGVKHQST